MLFEKRGEFTRGGHGGRGAGFGHGKRGDGLALAGGGEEIALVLHVAGGETADEGIARAGGIDHLDDMGREGGKGVGLGDEAAALAEREDDHRRTKPAAKRVQGGGCLPGERGPGVGFFRIRRDEEIHQRDKLGLVGHEDIGIAQKSGIEIRAHGRGVEQGGRAGLAADAQGVGDGGEAGFQLGDDDARAAEERGGKIARSEGLVGSKGDDDLVLPGVIHQNSGGTGGELGLGDEAGGDFVFSVKCLRHLGKGIRADRADEKRSGPGPAGRDRLVGALAPRPGGETAERGLPGGGESGATPGKILNVAADDNDGGSGGRRHEVEARSKRAVRAGASSGAFSSVRLRLPRSGPPFAANQRPSPVDPRLDLSIIIPAFNEEKLLAASLDAVKTAATAALSDAGLRWELVVCDNNSTDRTAAIARTAGAKIVFEPINQIGRARNTGASAATGAWLLFIDADSHPSRELLTDAARLTRRADVLLVGSTIALDEATAAARFACGVWNAASRVRRLVAGSFILVRAAAFREVGGFDLKFFAGEELDLALRLQRIVGRREHQRTVILHRHPLVTSARKLKLYRKGELARFLLKSVFRPIKTTTNRADCDLWYDGRR